MVASARRTGDVESRAIVEWRSAVPRLVEHVRRGLPLNTACALERVSRRTMEAALARQDPDVAPIVAARADREAQLVAALDARVRDGLPSGAAQFALERHNPRAWHLPTRVQMSGDPENDTPIRTEDAPVTEDALRARLEALRAKLGG